MSLFNSAHDVFTTYTRNFSSVQLLVNEEFFRQSSFVLIKTSMSEVIGLLPCVLAVLTRLQLSISGKVRHLLYLNMPLVTWAYWGVMDSNPQIESAPGVVCI